MKKYLYAIPLFVLIDPLISFALASWVFSQNSIFAKKDALFFCLFSFAVALVLICFSIGLMVKISIRNPRAIQIFFALIGLFYLALGIYSLVVQPVAIASDFYTQLGAEDPSFFIRLLKSSSIQTWSVSLSALFMFCVFSVKQSTGSGLEESHTSA